MSSHISDLTTDCTWADGAEENTEKKRYIDRQRNKHSLTHRHHPVSQPHRERDSHHIHTEQGPIRAHCFAGLLSFVCESFSFHDKTI